jgi:O-antigen/teichoic acid export membrane protein
MITAFLTSGIGYGTNLIIAASHPMEVAGLYYWGFSMSAQAVFLLVTNLQGILFPAFASMGESVERQRTAFEQTTAVLTLVVVPITCLQVLLAQPVVALLFQPRWLPAVPVIQWLSVGMLTQPLNVVGVAILMARGEYRKTACVTAVMALFTLAAALLGSHLGEEKQIAQLVSIATLVTNVLPGWTAYRSLGGDGRRLWHILAGPILLGIPLAVFGFLVNEAVVRLNPLLRIFSVSLAAAVIYGALVRWRSPEFLTIVFLRLRQLREKK